MLEIITHTLLTFANHMGYAGVYLYMLMVGTFIPVPSEILLIPEGYIASIGDRNLYLLILFGALGSLSGALINYFLAKYLVNRFLKDKPIIKKTSLFFKRHGAISVFLAPLTPGLGQYISIPAGLSHMSLKKFIPLTLLSNTIWVSFMLLIGYIFGKGNSAHKDAAIGSTILLGFVIISISIYVLREIKKTKNSKSIDDEL